jgi:alkylated DNA repair dioxygenase AlkB
MEAPVEYIPDFIPDNIADVYFESLMSHLDWIQRDNTPRMEYYVNDTKAPYTYGVGEGQRTYEPQPYHPVIHMIRVVLERRYDCVFDVCFLNRYDTSRHGLGWHADDSPEMDPQRPIVTVSLGQPREIQFRPKGAKDFNRGTESLLLEHGSAAVMAPGMQESWEHRIPKAGFVAKPRISLTYRGYVHNG